jgi:3-oxoacyl-[acyl-carrier protein] reductase
MDEKVALVTGSSSGIGQAAAARFAKNGFNVVTTYLSRPEGARETVASVEGFGRRGLAVRCDVSDESSVEEMVAHCAEDFGRLDVLVNAAGTTATQPPNDLSLTTMDAWDRIMDVNVKGLFLVTRACAQLLAVSHGSVVNLGSLAGTRPTGVQPYAYSASKAAVVALTKLFAANLGPEIRVNAVLPGWVSGSWMEEQLGENYEGLMERRARLTPLRRVANNEDVAEAIYTVATSLGIVSGQLIVADGGFSSTT